MSRSPSWMLVQSVDVDESFRDDDLGDGVGIDGAIALAVRRLKTGPNPTDDVLLSATVCRVFARTGVSELEVTAPASTDTAAVEWAYGEAFGVPLNWNTMARKLQFENGQIALEDDEEPADVVPDGVTDYEIVEKDGSTERVVTVEGETIEIEGERLLRLLVAGALTDD